MGPQLVAVEVGLLEQAAGLEHDHALARLRQRRGDHTAAGTGADHHRVRLVGGFLALGHERRRGLGQGLGRGLPVRGSRTWSRMGWRRWPGRAASRRRTATVP